MMTVRTLLFWSLIVLIIAPGCRLRRRDAAVDYARSLPAGAAGVVELPVAQWPRFTIDASERVALRRGIAESLIYLDAPSAQQHFPIAGIEQGAVKRGLQRFAELLERELPATELQAILEEEFRVFTSVGYDDRGSVLFTGYYTPIFQASRQRSDTFRYPLYRRPADLVNGPSGKQLSQRRLADGSLVPYPSRAEIERSGMLRGNELVWLADPFEAYVVHVQGSGFLEMRDGSRLEVGYDGTNGHDYRSVGLALVADGHLRSDQLSLDTMRAFFRRSPHFVEQYLNRNPRFVFFRINQGGPFGSLGRPVTPDVSIATDKSIFPRAALCFIDVDLADPRPRPYQGFRLDQDTGGAIRAPGRCDLYMGVGFAAERRAGRQMAHGRLYYLVAK